MSQLRIHGLAITSWLAISWLATLVLLGLLAPWLPLPYPPAVPDLLHVAEAPDWSMALPHWLGTDPQGRDVLTELIYGARQVVILTLPAAALATLAGALAGGAAGFWGNHGLRLALAGWLALLAAAWWGLALPGGPAVWLSLGGMAALAWWGRHSAALARATCSVPLDSLFQGLLTLLGTVPRLMLLLAFAAGPALAPAQLLALLALVTWPEPARLVRAQMLQVRELPFVEAARVAGVPPRRVWYRHALPHACRPLLATAPLSLARLIGLESTLAFLGIGRSPDIPSWGSLLSTLPQEPGAWWVLAGAGSTLFLTLLALQQLARQITRR